MQRTLIISEKADAARRIAYFLSEGNSKQKSSKGLSFIEFQKGEEEYYVVPLSGHIIEIDFPKELKDWKPEIVKKLISSGIEKKVKNKRASDSLIQTAINSQKVIVATDYDREGELIGVEALEIIKNKTPFKGDIQRAKFSALTGTEIREAFDNLIAVDYNLSDSAKAREEIDLLWGAVLTRYFSIITGRMGKDFLSIGRVQTPTLAIVVKRELEIESFVPRPFWVISVDFLKETAFRGTLEEGPIFEEARAEKILSEITGKNGKVTSFEKKEERIPRPPPFSTTDFLREASRIGVQPGKAMKIAENLYVKGYISYPRTDNTVYQRSIPLKSIAEKLMESDFRKEAQMVLSQEKIKPTRGRTETTDHPPIYPVSVPKKGALKGDENKVYELIVRRFLSTIYRDGIREVKTAIIDIAGYPFKTSGLRIIDPAWLEIYTYRKVKEIEHPDLVMGEDVKATSWNKDRDETKPPPRYDMASLIKEMETLRLGTKSTRHSIIEKLQDRGFIEGNPVRPTPLGKGLIKAVLTVDSKISEPDMTAELESKMDLITQGEITREAVVNESRDMLRTVLKSLEKAESQLKDKIKNSLNEGIVIGKCPEHNTDIKVIKNREYIKIKCVTEGCKIDYTSKIMGLIKETDKKCDVCGLPLINIIRRGQSPELRCIDKDCSYNKDKIIMGKCPRDGGDMIIRQSRYGKRFLGCSNYPKCTNTYALPQKGTVKFTGEYCPICNSPLIMGYIGARRWKFCPDMKCEYNKRKEKVERKEKPATA